MANDLIGENIKRIRLSLGMTMEDFGKMFTPPAAKSIVSRWEKDESLPSPKRLRKIVELGNTTIENLLHGNSKKGSLIIWFKNGQTAKFKDVKITGRGSLLTFTYFSQSDLVKRDAAFSFDYIAGYSFGYEDSPWT
ncbi:hypothetical protein FC89_GL000289 [Liquorilactobacillus ghanensis DSM 18630]|uniref:HTH cro/C1-type domain-containing protein n=1 Tax=Liquorilactobacillus ghanensis DSM 18630 TaxID=1423750 RepID=A0A0R1VU86_9LACO|nr:helix-turn-helix transcriptional regulator [Liquorilactobacillus ghanensis]KRM06980.1 hypothetical protein FC89_GL000289 [Liquorilactobacillus ghanensis DSM 18630]